MNFSINDLHKAFENRIRLGVMSALTVHVELDFTALKKLLEVTDGKLASHLKMLGKESFVSVEKTFIDRKPNTKYFITADGKKAFEKHLNVLEQIIKSMK